MIHAGIDVGFGAVKAAASSGAVVEFSSVIGDFRPVAYSFTAGQPLSQRLAVEYQGRRYFLGETALVQSAARQTVEKNRTIDGEGRLLLAAALGLLAKKAAHMQAEAVRLVIGLPVLHFESMRQRYLEEAAGLHDVSFLTLAGQVESRVLVRVEDCRVIPQPAGCLFDAILDDTGRIVAPWAGNRVGIVDIGHNTLDLAVFEKLVSIGQRSTSFSQSGMHAVYQALAGEIFRQFEYEVTPEQAEAIARAGFMRLDGKTLSIAAQCRTACQQAAEQVAARVKSTWPDLRTLEKILFCGGGSLALAEHLSAAFGEKAFIVANPVQANARGFLKYAARTWKEGTEARPERNEA